MVSKNRVGKVAVVSVVAGVLAVAGLGMASPAFADNGSPGNPVTERRPGDDRPGPGPNALQMAPMPGNRGGPNQGGPQAGPNQGGPNANRPGIQQPGPRPGAQAPNAANNAEAVRARDLIAAAAEVLAVQPEAVLAGLEQGQTLTQVAASKGLTRDYFLSELVSQIEKDIKDGQRFGIPASPDLRTQVANLVDEPSLGIRGAALSALF